MTSTQIDHLATVRGFFARWGTSYEEFCQSFRDGFAEDGTWVAAPGLPPTVGAEQAVGLLEQFKAGFNMGACQVEMVRMAQDGDTVWCERRDSIEDANGNEIVLVEVAGILTLDDEGKIRTYVDYWDMAGLNAKAVTAG